MDLILLCLWDTVCLLIKHNSKEKILFFIIRVDFTEWPL